MVSGSALVRASRNIRLRNRGFTYIALFAVIVIVGIGLAAAGPVLHTLQMRDKERELLFVGDQFRQAIALYYERTPGGPNRYPQKLEDLLRDERYPGVQRYLRRIYVDPMTGRKEWGLVEMPGVGIMGVHSLSELPPIKTAGFPPVYAAFTGAQSYADWKFVYIPGQAAAQPKPPPAPPQAPLLR
jgi:type II secretory pathway pseudopilin PulG